MANAITTSNQLAFDICTSGYRYLYGAKGQAYTAALVNQLRILYPNYINLAEALKDADKGYQAIDCSGFVCAVLGIPHMGSAQLRSTALKRLPVSKSNAKPGMAIWRPGHIAYIGEGLKIYEAASAKTDMKISAFENRAEAFTELLVIRDSALALEPPAGETTEKEKNPYPMPARTIQYIKNQTVMNGDDVKWVQWELREAGYEIEIDGRFGPASDKALRAFQASCKILIDGKCGPDTRNHLTADGGLVSETGQQNATDTVYVVQSNDTLSRIAKTYGTTVAKLQKLNGIKDADKIYVGQRLSMG